MKTGDRIVYPMHGAGEVTGIEENEVGGVVQSYYVLRMPMGNLKLMLPVDKVEEIGIREIIDKSKVESVAEVLSDRADYAQGSWNKRFHANLERMKSGDILEVAAVARNLFRQNLKRKISSGERRLLDLSRQILISELVYVFEQTPDEVSAWVDEQIDQKNSDETDENISEEVANE